MAKQQLAAGGAGCGAWLDQGLRAALHQDGCRLLEQLLEDPDLAMPGNQFRPGEKCDPERSKNVETVLGRVRLRRCYFYRPSTDPQEPGQGRFPLDEALGLVNGYSCGLAKIMCRAGAMSSGYQAASADLKAYTGLDVEGRQIQRMVQLKAAEIQIHARACTPLQPAKAASVFYASVDGTGVPMMAEELEDRPGKQEDGSSKTREVKLGCVFTQQTSDEEGHPLRDPDSTTYISSFQPAKEFGPLIRAEALRRGMGLAVRVVLLGDGAAWIWEIARTCFPFAVQIVDFFHACEHLTTLAESLLGKGTGQAREQQSRWRAYLEVDQVGAVIAEAKRLCLPLQTDLKVTNQAIGYFDNNENRMLYGTFRARGFFIGSGVVEAGCKTVIGQRVKQSGMLWSVCGAGKVLDIRCAVINGGFESYWETSMPALRNLKEAA